MKIKTVLLFLVISLFSLFINESKAETKSLIVFETYDDYMAKKGTVYKGEYKANTFIKAPGKKKLFITFKNKNKKAENRKVKIALKETWGFSLNGLLFRVDKKTSCPHYVRSQGKIYYYENGYAVLNKLKKKDPSLEVNIEHYMDSDFHTDAATGQSFSFKTWGVVAYFSETLNSEFFEFKSRTLSKFVKRNSKYQEVYDCMFSNKRRMKRWKKRRICINAYNNE